MLSNMTFQLMWVQAWQIVIVSFAALLVTRMLGRNRSSLAYGIWLIVAVKSVTPPMAGHAFALAGQLPAPVWSSANVTPESDEFKAVDGQFVTIKLSAVDASDNRLNELSAVDVGDAFNTESEEFDSELYGWTFALLLLLCAGSALSAVVLTKRFVVCLRAIRSNATSEFDQSVAASLRHIAVRIDLKQSPRVIVSDVLFGPAVLGIFRPTIVLPKCLLESSHGVKTRSKQLELILAHELMHIRRGDLWVGALQAFVHCLWWFHPCVWFVNRALSRETERCCDEAVISQMNCSPADYARSLLSVIETKQSLNPVPVFPGMKPVEITSQRMERIMKLTNQSHSRFSWITVLALAAFACVALPGAAVGQKADSEKPVAASGPDAESQTGDAGLKQRVQSVEARPESNLTASITILRTSKVSADALLGKPAPTGRAQELSMIRLRGITNGSPLGGMDNRGSGIFETTKRSRDNEKSYRFVETKHFGPTIQLSARESELPDGVQGYLVESKFDDLVYHLPIRAGHAFCCDITSLARKATENWSEDQFVVAIISLHDSMSTAFSDLEIPQPPSGQRPFGNVDKVLIGHSLAGGPGLSGQILFGEPDVPGEVPAEGIATSKDELVRYEVEVYGVEDLVGNRRAVTSDDPFLNNHPPAGVDDFESLIDLITLTVEPGSWDRAGGEGRIQKNEEPKSLVIKQTREVHEQVWDLMRQLRDLKQQSTVSVRVYNVADLLDGAMGRSYVGGPNRAVGTHVDSIASTSKAATRPAPQAPLEQASHSKVERPLSDFTSLIALIKASVEPHSWGDTARIEPNLSTQGLVIRQSGNAHDQITNLLTTLRRGRSGIVQFTCRILQLDGKDDQQWLHKRVKFNNTDSDSSRSWYLFDHDTFNSVWQEIISRKPRIMGQAKVLTVSDQTANIATSGGSEYSIQLTPKLYPDDRIIGLQYAVSLQAEMPADTPLQSSLMQDGQTVLLQIDDEDNSSAMVTLVAITATVVREKKMAVEN